MFDFSGQSLINVHTCRSKKSQLQGCVVLFLDRVIISVFVLSKTVYYMCIINLRFNLTNSVKFN